MADFWLTQREQLLNRGLEVWKPVDRRGQRLLPRRRHDAAARDRSARRRDARDVRPARGQARRARRRTAGRSESSTSCRSRSAMEMLLTGESIDAETRAAVGARQPRRPGRRAAGHRAGTTPARSPRTRRSPSRRQRSSPTARATSISRPGFAWSRRWPGFSAPATMRARGRRRSRRSAHRTSTARRHVSDCRAGGS